MVLGIVGLSMPFQQFLIEQMSSQNNPFRSFRGTWRIGLPTTHPERHKALSSAPKE